MSTRRQKSEVQTFNGLNAIGTPVRYWRGVKGDGDGQAGKTTSEAFLLGGHTPSIFIDTCRGAVALSHVEVCRKGEDSPLLPSCPKCKRRKDVSEAGDRMFYCHDCKMQFDDQPNEGGDHDDKNPARRLEREEEQRQRGRGAGVSADR